MVHLTLPPQAFDKEIQVVIEERRMRTDDNPQSVTWERFMAAANVMGPYHHPIIGWQVDLDHMTVEDLKDWYQKWYAPNNATIIVVGDVKTEEVFSLAEKYFGRLLSRQLPLIRSQKEIPPLGERRIKVEIPANLPYLIIGFDVPSIKSSSGLIEAYALAIASAVLDGGDSSRFARELIRGQQIAVSATTYYDLFKKYDTQFVIAAIPTPGHTIVDLEAKIMEQINKLVNEPIPEEELRKVKTQLLAQEVFEKDSMSDQATMLGVLESVGLSWQVADDFPEKIKAVTAKDIQDVAKKYFNSKRLTVAELIPENVSG
jgi:zinc protease